RRPRRADGSGASSAPGDREGEANEVASAAVGRGFCGGGGVHPPPRPGRGGAGPRPIFPLVGGLWGLAGAERGTGGRGGGGGGRGGVGTGGEGRGWVGGSRGRWQWWSSAAGAVVTTRLSRDVAGD